MAIKNPFANLSTTQKYVVAGGGLAIGVFALIQHHSKTGSWSPFASGTAASTTAAAAGTGTDPVTGMPYTDDSVTDPLTGETYLAEAETYGSVAAAEASVSSFGQSTATGSGIPVNPASPASAGSINTPVGSSVYTSNAAWAQAATAGLTDVGYSGTDVATALGDYLTQTPLTPAQATLVNTAIAEYGPAPVGSLQVILQPTAGPATTPPPATPAVAMVTVPNVVGLEADQAGPTIGSVGLKSTLSGPAFKAGGPQVRIITAQSPKAGASVDKGSTVTLTYKIQQNSLQPNTK